jgi:putative ABC transport system permease protein
MLLKLAWQSLLDRKGSVLLTLLSLSLSVMVVLGVEHIRGQVRQSFTRTVSGVDLIVGARTSPLNLLLYSVFRIGNATNNIGWESYQAIEQDARVAWSIPLSLGDSHRGFRVVGTTDDYFTHFRYGSQQSLSMSAGAGAFGSVFSAVLGAEVARSLGYALGEEIVLSHGLGDVSFSRHENNPFTVTGILAPTGTPVDQAVYISLQGMEAIHLGWQNGVPIPGAAPVLSEQELQALQPKAITAVLLGLDSRLAVFSVQREINEFQGEALSAILPGVALAELWQSMRLVEGVLTLISGVVLVASLLGLATMLLASMQQRQRELALYRAIGARPGFLLLLIEFEALLITAAGLVMGFAGAAMVQALIAPWLQRDYGLSISGLPWSGMIAAYIGIVLGAAALLALIPALSAYRRSLGGALTQAR